MEGGWSQPYPCLKPVVRFIYSKCVLIQIELLQRKAGVSRRLGMNQVLRLGFRTLSRATLKLEGQWLYFGIKFLPCLSIKWPVHWSMSRLCKQLVEYPRQPMNSLDGSCHVTTPSLISLCVALLWADDKVSIRAWQPPPEYYTDLYIEREGHQLPRLLFLV